MKKILFLVWVFAAISSSLSYDALAIAPRVNSELNQATEDDNDADSKSTRNYSYQIVKNVSPNLQVDFHPDLVFEFEFPIELDNTHNNNHVNEKESEEYFKTLFHFIISPNAP